MNKKTLIFFRHGQTDWNVEERIQGHRDIPLNKVGKDQAARLAEHIKERKIEIIMSSDLVRAHETALIVSNYCKVPVIATVALREVDAGAAEGLLKKDLLASPVWAGLSNADARYDHIGFENGETKQEAKKRIRDWLTTYLAETSYSRIGICSHGKILRLLFIELGYEQRHLENTECFEIEW